MLSLAEKKTTCVGSRRTEIILFGVSQRNNHLISDLAEKKQVVLGLAKNKSACFGSMLGFTEKKSSYFEGIYLGLVWKYSPFARYGSLGG